MSGTMDEGDQVEIVPQIVDADDWADNESNGDHGVDYDEVIPT